MRDYKISSIWGIRAAREAAYQIGGYITKEGADWLVLRTDASERNIIEEVYWQDCQVCAV